MDALFLLMGMSLPVIIAVVMVIQLLYLLPVLVAILRHHDHSLAIFMLTVFLGWTLVGWIIAVIWSFIRATANSENMNES